MATYAYIRVSTEDQNLETQKFGVLEYANKNDIGHVEFIEEKVTSRKNWKLRGVGELVINTAQAGDTILFTEATRAARSTLELLEIMKEATEKRLQIIFIKENLRLNVTGQTEMDAIMTKNYLTILGMMGEMAREFTRQRTKEGVARARAEGKQIGRPKGGKNKELKLDKHYKLILRALAAGQTRAAILRMLNDKEDFQTHRNTLAEWLEHWKINKTLGSNPTEEERKKYRAFINKKRQEIAAKSGETENANS